MLAVPVYPVDSTRSTGSSLSFILNFFVYLHPLIYPLWQLHGSACIQLSNSWCLSLTIQTRFNELHPTNILPHALMEQIGLEQNSLRFNGVEMHLLFQNVWHWSRSEAALNFWGFRHFVLDVHRGYRLYSTDSVLQRATPVELCER